MGFYAMVLCSRHFHVGFQDAPSSPVRLIKDIAPGDPNRFHDEAEVAGMVVLLADWLAKNEPESQKVVSAVVCEMLHEWEW